MSVLMYETMFDKYHYNADLLLNITCYELFESIIHPYHIIIILDTLCRNVSDRIIRRRTSESIPKIQILKNNKRTSIRDALIQLFYSCDYILLLSYHVLILHIFRIIFTSRDIAKYIVVRFSRRDNVIGHGCIDSRGC